MLQLNDSHYRAGKELKTNISFFQLYYKCFFYPQVPFEGLFQVGFNNKQEMLNDTYAP